MVSFYTLNNIYLTTNPPGKNLNVWERKTEREGEREREWERGYTQKMLIIKTLVHGKDTKDSNTTKPANLFPFHDPKLINYFVF